MLLGKTLPEVCNSMVSFDLVWSLTLSVVQEVYLTREEAIAAKVDDTYRDPLTKLYEVEYIQTYLILS
jgi:hypothetical protein